MGKFGIFGAIGWLFWFLFGLFFLWGTASLIHEPALAPYSAASLS
jgi:hypothetical protein